METSHVEAMLHELKAIRHALEELVKLARDPSGGGPVANSGGGPVGNEGP